MRFYPFPHIIRCAIYKLVINVAYRERERESAKITKQKLPCFAQTMAIITSVPATINLRNHNGLSNESIHREPQAVHRSAAFSAGWGTRTSATLRQCNWPNIALRHKCWCDYVYMRRISRSWYWDWLIGNWCICSSSMYMLSIGSVRVPNEQL